MGNGEIYITVSNKSQNVGVGVAGGNNKIGITGDNSQYFFNEARKSAEQAKQSATEAQSFAEQAENSKNELLNDTGFVAVKDNLDSVITTAVNIEDINTNAENIEAIKDASTIALGKADRDLSNLTEEGQSKFDAKADKSELNNKANKDLNNVVEIAEGSLVDNELKNKLNKQQITNCLLEVPQRIKLELNNGVLTLKAGSQVIVPNGFEVNGTTPKFDEVIIESDITSGFISSTDRDVLVYLNMNNNTLGYNTNVTETHSGTSAPSGVIQYHVWYDTANNIVKMTVDKGVTWTTGYSLPIALAKMNSSSVVTSIDQVFNGIGYIGSTFWVDKGVKGLIPDGRNEDGSLKNIELVTTNVKTRTITYAYDEYFVIRPDGSLVELNKTDCFIQEETPNITQGKWQRWFNIRENYWYYHDNTQTTWIKAETSNKFAIISSNIRGTNGIITSFQPKLPFRAADYNELGAKVNKSGGTMTGNLAIEKSDPLLNFRSIAADSSVTSSSFLNVGTVMVRDKNNQITGYMQNSLSSGNLVQTSIGARRKINGTDKTASMSLSVDGSGKDFCYFPKCTTKATTTSSAADNKVAVIVKNYVNGASWYRVWSDGWIEQGGLVSIASGSDNRTVGVTFLKSFSNTNYTITGVENTSAGSSTQYTNSIRVSARATNSATIKIGFSQNSNWSWYACGY